MKNRSTIIIIAVAVLITLILFFRMSEMYKGEVGPSMGPTPEKEEEEDEVEEDPEVKKKVEEKGITQEDLDALVGLL